MSSRVSYQNHANFRIGGHHHHNNNNNQAKGATFSPETTQLSQPTKIEKERKPTLHVKF